MLLSDDKEKRLADIILVDKLERHMIRVQRPLQYSFSLFEFAKTKDSIRASQGLHYTS
jgi:hypothetical protein